LPAHTEEGANGGVALIILLCIFTVAPPAELKLLERHVTAAATSSIAQQGIATTIVHCFCSFCCGIPRRLVSNLSIWFGCMLNAAGVRAGLPGLLTLSCAAARQSLGVVGSRLLFVVKFF
jgi:hypothetical protein